MRFFRKKDELTKLTELYQKLVKEAYKLSHISRADSDAKMLLADEVAEKIRLLKMREETRR